MNLIKARKFQLKNINQLTVQHVSISVKTILLKKQEIRFVMSIYQRLMIGKKTKRLPEGGHQE